MEQRHSAIRIFRRSYQHRGGGDVWRDKSYARRVRLVEPVWADLADLVAGRYGRSPNLHAISGSVDFEGATALVRETTSRIVGLVRLHALNGGHYFRADLSRADSGRPLDVFVRAFPGLGGLPLWPPRSLCRHLPSMHGGGCRYGTRLRSVCSRIDERFSAP